MYVWRIIVINFSINEPRADTQKKWKEKQSREIDEIEIKKRAKISNETIFVPHC